MPLNPPPPIATRPPIAWEVLAKPRPLAMPALLTRLPVRADAEKRPPRAVVLAVVFVRALLLAALVVEERCE